MEEGLYCFTFRTAERLGAGVAFLAGSYIQGGDSTQYFLGRYQLDGNHITAQIRASVHTRLPGTPPVFGRNNARVELSGVFTGHTATLTWISPDAPGMTLNGELRKLPVTLRAE